MKLELTVGVTLGVNCR